MRDIPEARQLLSIERVASFKLHSQILEMQARSPNWELFERILLEEYNLDDLFKITKKKIQWIGSSLLKITECWSQASRV